MKASRQCLNHRELTEDAHDFAKIDMHQKLIEPIEVIAE